MTRLVLLGYFGFGNAGDEAILAAEVAALRSTLGDELEFVVISGDPAHTLAAHRLRGVSRTDVAGVLGALRWCDALIAGGGSLLQDVTSARPVPFYAGVMLAARGLRTPVFGYAQGLGPLRGRLNRTLVGAALRSSAYVAVRDVESLSLARSLGVRGVELVPDPVLGLTVSSGPDTGRGRSPRLAVALRPWIGLRDWLPEVQAALAELARDVEILMVPFHAGQDVELARSVAEIVPGACVVEALGHAAACDAVAGSDAVLGMRLHALVVAAAAGLPFAAISYDPKVPAFANQVGQPVVARVPGPVDRDAVVAGVRKALEGPDLAYLDRLASLRRLVRRPAEEIARLLRPS